MCVHITKNRLTTTHISHTIVASHSIKRVEMVRDMTRRSTGNLHTQGANFIPAVSGKNVNLHGKSLDAPHTNVVFVHYTNEKHMKSMPIFLFSKEFPENVIGGKVRDDMPRFFYDSHRVDRCFRIEFGSGNNEESVTIVPCALQEALENSNAIVGLHVDTKGVVSRNDEKIIESGCFSHERLVAVLSALEKASVQY